jgi:hypothetical protein
MVTIPPCVGMLDWTGVDEVMVAWRDATRREGLRLKERQLGDQRGVRASDT